MYSRFENLRWWSYLRKSMKLSEPMIGGGHYSQCCVMGKAGLEVRYDEVLRLEDE